MRLRTIILTLVFASLVGVLVFTDSPIPRSHPYFAQPDAAQTEIIAHRGGQTVRPANTLLALETALAMGADVLEIDAQQTADGVLVLRHDDTLDRTTNMRGPVADKTLAQLRQADAGANSRFGDISFAGRGIGIPTLEAAFARFPNARWVIEIKNDSPQAAQTMCNNIRQANAQTRVLVGSFHDSALADFRAACPEVATSMASNEATRFVLGAKLGLTKFLRPRAQALQIPTRARGLNLAEPRLIAAARAHGLKVQYWTINDPTLAHELIALGANGIITDDVGAMRAPTGRATLPAPPIF